MKWSYGWIAVGTVVIGLIVYTTVVHDAFNRKDDQVQAAWTELQYQYQRRADLADSLVQSVRTSSLGHVAQLDDVMVAHSRAVEWNKCSTNLCGESLVEYYKVQKELAESCQALLMTLEGCCDAPLDESLLRLAVRMSEVDRSIAHERAHFDEVIGAYNGYYGRFPQKAVAKLSPFGVKSYVWVNDLTCRMCEE